MGSGDKKNCVQHDRFQMLGGELICIMCGEPSDSKKWKHNVFGGAKAAAQNKTANKQLSPHGNK